MSQYQFIEAIFLLGKFILTVLPWISCFKNIIDMSYEKDQFKAMKSGIVAIIFAILGVFMLLFVFMINTAEGR